jgi:hypothetical protein
MLTSVIRLKRLDDSPCLCGYSLSSGSKYLPVRSLKNRKLSSLGIGLRRSRLGELPNQVIQRRTKAVEKITDDQRNKVRNRFYIKPDDIPLILDISLSLDLVRLSLREVPKFLPQSVKVYLLDRILRIISSSPPAS